MGSVTFLDFGRDDERWIEKGAPYEKHWAFEPSANPPGDGSNQFVRAALPGNNLDPSPEADPA